MEPLRDKRGVAHYWSGVVPSHSRDRADARDNDEATPSNHMGAGRRTQAGAEDPAAGAEHPGTTTQAGAAARSAKDRAEDSAAQNRSTKDRAAEA